jgi:hypothetical protein
MHTPSVYVLLLLLSGAVDVAAPHPPGSVNCGYVPGLQPVPGQGAVAGGPAPGGAPTMTPVTWPGGGPAVWVTDIPLPEEAVAAAAHALGGGGGVQGCTTPSAGGGGADGTQHADPTPPAHTLEGQGAAADEDVAPSSPQHHPQISVGHHYGGRATAAGADGMAHVPDSGEEVQGCAALPAGGGDGAGAQHDVTPIDTVAQGQGAAAGGDVTSMSPNHSQQSAAGGVMAAGAGGAGTPGDGSSGSTEGAA